MTDASNNSTRPLRRQLFGTLLFVPIFAACYGLSYLLRFAGEPFGVHSLTFQATLVAAVGVKLVAAHWFQLHHGWSRYVTFHDVMVLVQAVTCSSIGLILIDAFLLPELTIPRSVVLLDWGCTLVGVGGVWGIPRLLRDGGWQVFTTPHGKPALIVGANDSGEALLRTLRRSASLDYCPVGFVDDRREMLGRRISGVPVVGTTAQIAHLAERYNAQEVLITAGDLPGKQVRELLDRAGEHDLHVKVLPSYRQLLSGDVAVRPRSVAIEDLLRRPSVDLDLEAMREWLSGKTLLVTGSAGSIGSEICRQLLKLAPARLVLLDRSETGQFFIERELNRLGHPVPIEACLADATDVGRIDAVFHEYRPDVIFHAAAYKHVPLMEAHPGEAVKNIVLATRNLVDAAERHDASGLVMISTDKAVNPTSVMGSCKRIAEQYVQARASTSACRLVTVRFGNVLDSAGSVVPIFREQIARGGPVTVTHPEMIRFFMLIPEAARLVIQAGAMGQGGEIFVLDMGEPVRILDLAHDMIRLSGLRVGDDIEVKVVGLRPGEKLFEELYGDGELHQQTAHPKIMVATGAPLPLVRVINDVSRLADIADGPGEEVRQAIAEIVPQHRPAAAPPLRAAA